MKCTKPKNKRTKELIIFSLLILIFVPISAGAAGLVPCGGPGEQACTTCDLLVLTQNVLEFALKMAFLIIIGFIVYGGFRWIFSLGKEENLKAGQQIITNAIIGLVIILTAWIIVNTVFWTIKQMGGDDYTGTWFHIECPEAGSIFDLPEQSSIPIDDVDPGDQVTEPEPESNCTNCGGYLLDGNICDEAECLSLGNCEYYNYIAWPGGFCKPKQNDDENDENEEGWEDADQYPVSDSNQMCLPIAISRECGDEFNPKGKCQAGEHTIPTKSEITSNGKGWYCEFTGEINPAGSESNPCYPPIGTLYIDCIIDPDYIPPEEQIEQKKKEIEEKYPNLDGEWIEYPIMCPEWDQNCNETSGAAECGIEKKIKDGFCLAVEPSKLLNPPGEIYGNGWHCDFGKSNINSPSPEGKSFAYCVSEDDETPANPVESEPEPEIEPASKCEECGVGLFNICDKAECLSLGDCEFTNTFGPGGKCEFNNN